MSGKRRLSVAIPIYNEESVLEELYRRTVAVLEELSEWDYELVFVDDGSRDGSREWLEAICAINPRVKLVCLSRNFGHQAALTAALDFAEGDAVVLMDGDLQDTPETIPRFLAEFDLGYDVVYAVRMQRKEPWLLRCGYATFYRLISRLSDLELPRGAGDFALLSRRVVDHLRQTGERHRYLRGLRAWVGFRQQGIPVVRDARHAGRSKYSFRRLLQLACDGIFSFSIAPLRAATLLGLLTVSLSLGFAAYALLARLCFDRSPAGFTALILAVTFLAGVQLLFLGLIGEYVGRIYQEVKRRPHYVVDRLHCDQASSPTARDMPSTAAVAGKAGPAKGSQTNRGREPAQPAAAAWQVTSDK